MQKYLDIKQGEELDSTTLFTENEECEKVIQTNIASVINQTLDPGELDLSIGKAMRGSCRIVSLGNGRYAFRFRRFKRMGAPVPEAEPIYKSSHGRIYRNSRATRVVFEFPKDTSFSHISDALDDEVYEMRSFLDKEAPC